jgi:hypothetical protein
MITHSISSDIKRALRARGFLAGAAGMVLMIAVASLNAIISIQGVLGNGFHAELILSALTSDDVTLVLPILCTLPFAAVFVGDIKSGFIKQYLPRSGVPAYIKGKILASGLSGGLVLVAGLFAAYGISALVFTPMEAALEPGVTAPPYLAEILTKALTLFFSGAFWSLTGFTLASVTMSRYMAYASPFVLYYVLIILHERYFSDFFILYPKEWIALSEPWVLQNLGVWILLLVLCAVASLLFGMTAKRRLENV